MATCGYRDIAEFNQAELMVAPALQTEGKQLQRSQQVGMGSNGRSVARMSNSSPSSAPAGPSPLPSSSVAHVPAHTSPCVLGSDDDGSRDGRKDRRGRRAGLRRPVLQLIAGACASGVFSELLPHHVGAEEVARRKPRGLISPAGRPRSTPRAPRRWTRRCSVEILVLEHLLRHAAGRALARRPRRGCRGGSSGARTCG